MRAVGLAAGCWMAVFALAAYGLGVHDAALSPGVALLSILLVVAPAALALPAGRILGAPLWATETIVAWSLLGYLVLLVDPAVLGQGLSYLLGLPALLAALASPSFLIAAWWHPAAAPVLRRQAYLLAAIPCGLVLLHGLDALGPLSAIVYVLLLLSIQFLFWSGQRRSPQGASPAPTEQAAVPAPGSGPVAPAPSMRPAIAVVGRGYSA